jgi:hypothetical protein
MLSRFRVGDSLRAENAAPPALPAVSAERRSPARAWARSTARKAAAGSSTDWTEF